MLLLITAVVLFYNADAQKPFAGYIKYAISYEGEMDAQTKAMSPTEMKQFISGSKTRIEILTAMANQYVVSDGGTKEVLIMIDAMGQKFALKSTKEENEEQMAKMPKTEVKLLDETKEIVGYKCKKAEVTSTDEEGKESTLTVFYTTDLAVGDINWSGQFNGIKGVLMEYSQEANGVTTTFTASEVKKEKVKDTQFTVPADYKILTKEEAMQMFGGGAE
ncbi:MAG: hypothetical protein A2W91_01945 [Bacteroidetes bacterium GWF2_38_335]|nr:MAG: hypothetical protein A2W91_01945 [Bacteroidetes bacterium GWF2_38_335]OFY80615.1 MAG: hypothetical protein A2281_04960 [Bacteroidetes bacterium RIFOXYA12_FULL_38_20]HBS86955.1 hypothetical protein [Bacteroidales bacterium]